MRQIQINRNLILREDGKLFNVHTGEEYQPRLTTDHRYFRVGKHKRVHQLVMEYFGPPKPGPEYEIDHINRNSLDNRLENLRWVTHKENCYNKSNNRSIGIRTCDLTHKEYKKITLQEWRLKNKEHNREYQREYMRKYRAEKEKEG